MAFNPALCEGCPIQGLHRPQLQVGPETARFLVVVDRPSQVAASERRLMTANQMAVFSEGMQEAGFQRGDFRFTPAVHCAYDENAHVTSEQRAINKHCRQHLLAEIEQNNPHVVVPLGAKAATQTFGRGVKITKVRGLATSAKDFEAPVFALLAPAMVVQYPQNQPMFDADIQSFGRFVDSDYAFNAKTASEDLVDEGGYIRVNDLEFLIEQNPEILSFDTETTGLSWFQQGCDVRTYRPIQHRGVPTFKPRMQILTMQFSIRPGEGFMLVWDHPEDPIPERDKPRLRNQLRRLLCNPETIVIGQGNKYDNVILWMTEGIRYPIGGCTLQLATLVDENLQERNLDILTKIYVPHLAGYADRFNATVNKERMWEVPLSEMLPYGVGDADAALQVYQALEPQVMADEKLWAHYCRVSIPGLNTLAAIETRGMDVDEEGALASFKQTMIDEVEAMRVDLLSQLPRELKRDIVVNYTTTNAKGVSKPKGPPEKALSFTRKEFLKAILFTNPHGFRLTPRVFTESTKNLLDLSKREPSTSAKDHLPYFFDECPFTYQLAEFVKDESLLSKSIISFEKKYIVRGKVRPSYFLHVAVTGRTASKNPNGQNIPKRGARAKAYRKMFVAPPGYYIIEADYRQAELCIAAHMSGDPTMIEIYNSGGDIHRNTACIVLGVTMEEFNQLPKAEQKEARQKAKAVNFGYLYGMWWRKFVAYAKTQYGVEFTDREAERVREEFFSTYSALEPWHNRMKHFAQVHKYVRSLSGRIRHLPMIDSSEEYIQKEAGRQAVNSPVQEFASSLGVMAGSRVEMDIDPEYLRLIGFVHDALVALVKKEHLVWGMKVLKEYMQTNPLEEWFDLTLRVPIVADVGFGENLGEVYECEELSLDEEFDFDSMRDKDGDLPFTFEVPEQTIPHNAGFRSRSAYTLPTDLESEDPIIVPVRRRPPPMPLVSDEARRREERSQRQMVINRRHSAVRKEAEKQRRIGPLLRRSRPTI